MKIEKLTTPQKMSSDVSHDSDEMIKKFEEKFRKAKKGQSYYYLVICGEYSREACDRIETWYTKVGWNKVSCMTSSAGLTGLQLFI